MTTKKVLLALAATSLLAFGSIVPVYAEDPPPADEGTKMEVPADPDSAAPADAGADPGTEEGAPADAGGADAGGGKDGGEPPAPPQ
jgi:hypothetical protein